jgi:hypothetical protein
VSPPTCIRRIPLRLFPAQAHNCLAAIPLTLIDIALFVFEVFLVIVGWPAALRQAQPLLVRSVRPIKLAAIEKMVPYHASRQKK